MLFGWVRFLGKLDYVLIPSLRESLKMGNLNQECSIHFFCKPSEQDGKTLNRVKTSFVAAGM